MSKIINNRYVVEKEFEHNGLNCVVIMQRMGHRCGYVGVDKNHPLYGKRCDDYLDIKKADIGDREVRGVFPLLRAAFDDDERVAIEAYFDVHGDITYTGGGKGSKYPIESDLWWFGFDCAHWLDSIDFDIAKKLFAKDEEIVKQLEHYEILNRVHPDDGEIRTLDYVENECRNLADQLAEFK